MKKLIGRIFNISNDAKIITKWLNTKRKDDYYGYYIANFEILSIFFEVIAISILLTILFIHLQIKLLSTISFSLLFISLFLLEDIALANENNQRNKDHISSIRSFISSYFLSGSIIGIFSLYNSQFINKNLRKILCNLIYELGATLTFKVLLIIYVMYLIIHKYPHIYSKKTEYNCKRLQDISRPSYLTILEVNLNFVFIGIMCSIIYIILKKLY